MTAIQSATRFHHRGLIGELKHRHRLDVKDLRGGSMMVFWILPCGRMTEETMALRNGISQLSAKILGALNKK